MNTVLCPIILNSNTTELTVHTSCYWVLDLLCVNMLHIRTKKTIQILAQKRIEGLKIFTPMLDFELGSPDPWPDDIPMCHPDSIGFS